MHGRTPLFARLSRLLHAIDACHGHPGRREDHAALVSGIIAA